MERRQLSAKIEGLQSALANLIRDLRGFFGNAATHDSASHYLRGLLSRVARKNSWQMSEEERLLTPYRFQHLLGRSLWDRDKVRDLHLHCVQITMGAQGGTLIVDETGFLKKGTKSAGVGRQYSGTAGRIDNCQIGVFLAWAVQEGHTLIDRELYIPKDWYESHERLKAAHIPKDRPFYTKIELAQHMIKRAFDTGFQPSWVTADEVYGQNYSFRRFLEDHHQAYVLAVPKTQSICQGFNKIPAHTIAPLLDSSCWQKLSCGDGSKGPRFYRWAYTLINTPDPGYQRWLLLRKSLDGTEEISYFLVFAKPDTPLSKMVIAAGQRWKIEECFESAKGEVGLDQYEVRSFEGWYRHMTLVLLAHALLVKTKSQLFPDSPHRCNMQTFKKKRGLLKMSA